jgi:hypothetical protein
MCFASKSAGIQSMPKPCGKAYGVYITFVPTFYLLYIRVIGKSRISALVYIIQKSGKKAHKVACCVAFEGIFDIK